MSKFEGSFHVSKNSVGKRAEPRAGATWYVMNVFHVEERAVNSTRNTSIHHGKVDGETFMQTSADEV